MEQMNTTDTPELLTPPLTHTATCTAHTHASRSIYNITMTSLQASSSTLLNITHTCKCSLS